ncbi:MAG: C25 family cysteine peptidase, partial [Candidatus Eisenbacteria bacterium]|nr:C25 family cysteine peptidase [Candidatus Eisenbacteria bacterium]
MTRLIVFALAVLAVPALAIGDDAWIPLNGATHPGPVVVNTSNAGTGAVRLDIVVPGFQRSSVESKGGRFTRLLVADAGIQGQVGHPELPALRLMVAIPYGGVPRLEVISERIAETPLDQLGVTAPIVPVQAPVEKVPGAREQAPWAFDQAVYARDAFQLATMVSLGEPGFIRGRRFVELTVSPVDVNGARGTARLLTELSVRVTVENADLALTAARAARYGCREFDSLSRRLLVGGSSDARDLNGMPEPPMLLIIAGSSWAGNANLLNFVDWKTDKGLRPVLVSTTETGSTTASIKSYIQTAYDTWPIPPTHVLLVGDTGVIPHWVGIGDDSPATDLNYTMLEGSDYFPDVDLGRWSVADATDLANIVNKTLSYEQIGWSGDNTWEKYTVFMASEDNYSITEGTHNFVYSTYLQPDGYSCDKLYSHTYSATTQQVRDAHNAGRSLSIYSGHGDVTYWADGPVFYQSDVNNLTNTVYPFVQSYACLTGQYTSSECFSETWIRATRGAVGMMASSVTSYWTEDDILEKRVMEGFCANVNAGQENQTWTAGMMNYGKARFYAHFGGVPDT